MKKNNYYVLGIILGFVLLIVSILLKSFISAPWVDSMQIVLILIGSVSASICYVRFTYNRMMNGKNGKEFKIEVFDERNIMIKEKAGYIVNCITLFLLAIVSMIFIVLDYTIPAIMIGCIIVLQPIILIIVLKRIEKHF